MPGVMPAQFGRSARPKQTGYEKEEEGGEHGRVVEAEFRVNEGAPLPRGLRGNDILRVWAGRSDLEMLRNRARF